MRLSLAIIGHHKVAGVLASKQEDFEKKLLAGKQK
jgi:hypothetical protein